MFSRACLTGSILLLALFAVGCGYSEDEWRAQLAKYDKLARAHSTQGDELESAKRRVARLEQELEKAGIDISKLSEDLESKGTKISQLSSTLEEREKALAEYKRRALQLEKIKQRFERLRQKLQALTSLGLEVKIRNNRMIISLPGDVLFESGKDDLKDEGEDVLDKVASIINGDSGLKNRLYQVAGHTDNVELKGGMFYDNWGLSLLRARKVLLYPHPIRAFAREEVERRRLCRHRSHRQQRTPKTASRRTAVARSSSCRAPRRCSTFERSLSRSGRA